MRKLLGTSLLVLALGVSTHAGDMPFGITSPPPPPPSTSEPTDPSGGEIPFGEQATTEVLVNLLGIVLSLL